jgi:glycyl-tRNA synthetase beta chain
MIQNLLVELFVEELPPKALKKLGESFANVISETLQAQGLAHNHSIVTTYASPRRLAVHLTKVLGKAADQQVAQKLMPSKVGYDSEGQPSPALIKRLEGLGADASAVNQLRVENDGKQDVLFFDVMQTGTTLQAGLQKAIEETIAKLPIPKVMTYQLHSNTDDPGWESVNFVRPAHGLVALHGSEIVPIEILGLKASNTTHGHRFEAIKPIISLHHADDYEAQLLEVGAVIASFAKRRAEIIRQLYLIADELQLKPIEDDDLLDEVTALVERPNVLLGQFEVAFLEVPAECLILTMKANQKYFPLLDAKDKLTNQFLIVSNITPQDPSKVIGGNERVVRPRLSDAKFFFDQDRKKSLQSLYSGLNKVVYHNQLGSQFDRNQRVQKIADLIAKKIDPSYELSHQVMLAASLSKVDLLTDMVGEFPELQGIMGRYYAQHEGMDDAVAFAIEDHYKPKFAGDTLPRNRVGIIVSLADKLETLVGLFSIGEKPTGDKDPFALRRQAVGILRMLIEEKLPFKFDQLILDVLAQFESVSDTQEVANAIKAFCFDRLSVNLRDNGASPQQVDAVLSLNPAQLSEIPARLDAVRMFADLPEASALAAANKRVSNILKKIEHNIEAIVDASLLVEDSEKVLFSALATTQPIADKLFDTGDYTASLQALAALKTPVDDFFDKVMVNAEDPKLKANRQGLLAILHQTMNRVADLSKLAT